MLKAVIDTNIFVRALLKSKTARPILEALIQGKFKLITSAALIDELLDVLSRPYLKPYIDEKDKAILLSIIDKAAEIVVPTQKIRACRDIKDDFILECCMVKGSSCILVSSDKDLLALDPFRGLRIIPPEEFIATILDA